MPNDEPIVTRYVTDAEYAAQLAIAATVRDYLPAVFEFAYLLAARGIEITDLKRSDCGPDGITVARRKGSKTTIINWSDRLRAAYAAATALRSTRTTTAIDPYLITGRDGGQLRKATLDHAMYRLKLAMQAAGHGATFWTLHDLKRKGISDATNKRIAGHKSEAMRERYNTKNSSFDPPA